MKKSQYIKYAICGLLLTLSSSFQVIQAQEFAKQQQQNIEEIFEAIRISTNRVCLAGSTSPLINRGETDNYSAFVAILDERGKELDKLEFFSSAYHRVLGIQSIDEDLYLLSASSGQLDIIQQVNSPEPSLWKVYLTRIKVDQDQTLLLKESRLVGQPLEVINAASLDLVEKNLAVVLSYKQRGKSQLSLYSFKLDQSLTEKNESPFLLDTPHDIHTISISSNKLWGIGNGQLMAYSFESWPSLQVNTAKQVNYKGQFLDFNAAGSKPILMTLEKGQVQLFSIPSNGNLTAKHIINNGASAVSADIYFDPFARSYLMSINFFEKEGKSFLDKNIDSYSLLLRSKDFENFDLLNDHTKATTSFTNIMRTINFPGSGYLYFRKEILKSKEIQETNSDGTIRPYLDYSTTWVSGISTGESIDINDHNFLVYPNPFSNSIQINNLPNTHVSLELFDVMGRLVFKQENLEKGQKIMLHTLDKGIYIGKISSFNSSENIKLIKE